LGVKRKSLSDFFIGLIEGASKETDCDRVKVNEFKIEGKAKRSDSLILFRRRRFYLVVYKKRENCKKEPTEEGKTGETRSMNWPQSKIQEKASSFQEKNRYDQRKKARITEG